MYIFESNTRNSPEDRARGAAPCKVTGAPMQARSDRPFILKNSHHFVSIVMLSIKLSLLA